jgi:hypothetical protein
MRVILDLSHPLRGRGATSLSRKLPTRQLPEGFAQGMARAAAAAATGQREIGAAIATLGEKAGSAIEHVAKLL